jgi:hypothetical protein
LKENGDPFAFYDEKTEEFLDEKDPKWEKAVLEKFEWIRSLHTNNAAGEELTPD